MYKINCLYIFILYTLAAGATQSRAQHAALRETGCVLPEYPEHGTYTIHNKPAAMPGQTYDWAILTVTCDPGYGVVGKNSTFCTSRNIWVEPMPRCARFCTLKPHPSVKYLCKVTGNGVHGTRECNELEPHGTEVVPECNRPVYYPSRVLRNMHCVEGTWDHVARCQPDCGTSTPISEQLIINGTRTKHGEFPWHAGIYDKSYTPFKQICGGSLISTTVVISAAHCFWNNKGQHPVEKYAVALGKIYRPWNDPMDRRAHKSNVSEIKIPVLYFGQDGHDQEDIALVFMVTPVVYSTVVRPVCIDFFDDFDRSQLQSPNAGKVSGWGLTTADGSLSPVLLTAELPYVDVSNCVAGLPIDFRPYVTRDKICAGGKSGTAVCHGDSGGGLVFPSLERGVRRYYLRGVVSSAPSNGLKCNDNSYTTFTHIQAHATFITDFGLDDQSREGLIHNGGCVLPAYPPHGTYTVINKPEAVPGQTCDMAILTVTCDPGYRVVGSYITYCFGGNIWQKLLSECVRKDGYGLAGGATRSGQDGCVLPQFPWHGTYTVYNRPEAVPGQTYNSAILMVTCNPGYGVVGKNSTYCTSRNIWVEPMPRCARFCRLTPDPSVKYFCKVTSDGIRSTRMCNELEPDGTVVVPECNRPFYYSSCVLLNMHCDEGTWDHVAVCQPECGTPTLQTDQLLILNGSRAEKGELPWHAGIYDKTYTPFLQICGGSLVSTTVVISAAHCFWDDWSRTLRPPSKYAVALGKIYRPWSDPNDIDTQKSGVGGIKVPVRFMGPAGHYQVDIALVILSTPIVYVSFIRPVCIDFDIEFDRRQLQPGNMGKVSGWGLTSADGDPSRVLRTTTLPYVDLEQCIADQPYDIRSYFTIDKICAGTIKGTALCKGDGGGGLAFPTVDSRGTQRYYLRGVVSTAPVNGHKCNANAYTIITHIQQHDTFIKDYLNSNA